MTQKTIDNVIGTIVNQGITFLILFIIFKMTAFASSSKEVNDKIDSKVDKEVYLEDKRQLEGRLEADRETNKKTYEMVLFLYQNEIKKTK